MKPDYQTFSRLHKAIDYINSHDLKTLPTGKTVIDDDIYINVMEVETKAENIYEAHRDYIDIHCMIDGEEAIAIAPVEEMEVTEDYNKENDCVIGKAKGERHIVRTGQYCITMPSEAHSPCLSVSSPKKIRKAVFKVRY